MTRSNPAARGTGGADDTAGRTGEDRILALEAPGLRQPAIRLHYSRVPASSAATWST
jgi:hypothetical protein